MLPTLVRVVDYLRSQNLTVEQWAAVRLFVERLMEEFAPAKTPPAKEESRPSVD